ncbi:uncharacterized protein PHACADRAFT_177570 [Phanerochaete carnosa HHB-10118-sp]|uniref:Uncharacterized protein n=1 Tax=Phanerochaete carnosa (strain HHB-10118-sp) TaxID=650164 RepID=K5VHW6_PHACS|nr:uncharacterized protein PHACADRAFT_177570 [Phanerochaete carnosa HHB-10118-sp]EKM50838.1 hypothetical protein PHACADRAFT_177570 [Phanerochaete carnosa HHB-10118-sp]
MSGSGPRVAGKSFVLVTENWDDDFDFQPVSESHTNITSTPAKDASLSHRTVSSDTYGWAQPGPSTPPKRIGADTENWDVDFQDSTNSPSHMRTPPKSRRRRATENWDDDFEDRQTSPSKKSARWDWSDEEGSEFGIGDREEDRTLTSRFRRGAFPSVLLHESPPPPVPPIPSSFVDSRLDPQPFPRSPAASVFSVPVSGHGSVAGHSYSSTTHLALRPTLSTSSFGALPPSPPTHHARERRRLRKKSRPPRVDANIYELEDQSDPPPVTPERSKSPPHDSPPDATPSSAGKSSLVSRIGSVGKKWGAARKKRASMGPVDLALDEQREPQVTTSRPASMAVPSSPPASRWFFRAGGGPGAGTGSPPSNASTLPLKHEKSVDKFLAMVGLDQHETPSKRKQKIRQALPKDLTDMASKRESLAPEPSVVAGTPRTLRRPHGSRHASHSSRRTISSRGSSVPCSASASVDDVSSRRVSYAPSSQDDDMRTPRKSRSSLDPESGSRSFMGGMRRISLTKRHRRSKTTVHEKDKSPEGPSRPSTSTAATAVPRLSEHTASDNGLDITPRPPLRIAPRLSIDDKSLLPPIELRPPSPSPSREMSKSTSEPVVRDSRLDTALESALSSVPSSHSGTVKVFDSSSPPASSTLSKLSVSPQSASLGRATQPPKGKEVDIPIARRNSLGDLKIPTRISQAQVGLRRDLGMVRDFAYSVEHLRELQTTYHGLVVNFQAMLVEVAPVEETQPRVMPPTLFGLPLPGYRARSNTNPQASSQASKRTAEHRELAAAYHSLESKYRIAWECAELLVELGGGAPVQPPSSSSSALHTERSHTPVADGRRSRERAITLAGDETKPQVPFVVAAGSASNPSQWRASTGRHDLSHRQLLLLRDMLSSPDLSAIVTLDSHPEDVNRDWRWGDAMSSTVTLPSEYSSQHDTAAHGSATGPRRKSGRLGMRALRDMLRSLKKSHAGKHGGHHSPTVPPIPTSASSVSMGTMSSLNLPKSPDPSAAQRPPAKTSTGPESVTSLREHPNSPYTTPASVTHRSSPRRPSLASLFKLGQKSRSSTAKSSPSSGPGRELSRDDLHASSASPYPPSAPEEDWDKIESASDLEAVEASGLATVRRKKHRSMYVSAQEAAQVSRGNLNASQLSLPFADPPPTLSQARAQVLASDLERSGSHTRSTKLSDVKELAELDGMSARLIKKTTSKSKRQSYAGPSTKRPTSRNGKTAQGTGSLRSPPPAWQGPVETPDSKQILLPGGGGISLAMTPENIRPLLENARDVYVRCSECIVEMKSLLAAHSELG